MTRTTRQQAWLDDRRAQRARWEALPRSGHREAEADGQAERRAELRAAERSRCVHRSIEAVRHEPCQCTVIVVLPVYSCSLLAV